MSNERELERLRQKVYRYQAYFQKTKYMVVQLTPIGRESSLPSVFRDAFSVHVSVLKNTPISREVRGLKSIVQMLVTQTLIPLASYIHVLQYMKIMELDFKDLAYILQELKVERSVLEFKAYTSTRVDTCPICLEEVATYYTKCGHAFTCDTCRDRCKSTRCHFCRTQTEVTHM